MEKKFKPTVKACLLACCVWDGQDARLIGSTAHATHLQDVGEDDSSEGPGEGSFSCISRMMCCLPTGAEAAMLSPTSWLQPCEKTESMIYTMK